MKIRFLIISQRVSAPEFISEECHNNSQQQRSQCSEFGYTKHKLLFGNRWVGLIAIRQEWYIQFWCLSVCIGARCVFFLKKHMFWKWYRTHTNKFKSCAQKGEKIKETTISIFVLNEKIKIQNKLTQRNAWKWLCEKWTRQCELMLFVNIIMGAMAGSTCELIMIMMSENRLRV